MDRQNLIRELAREDGAKIVLLVMDGVGDYPSTEEGCTPLEKAVTPNLDRMVSDSALGAITPIAMGITPGSGPAHLALFGYDPLEHRIGRGILAALGIDFPLESGDVAARINFATLDEGGVVTDRRAGRIGSEVNRRLCGKLAQIEVEGVTIFVRTVKEHRAVAVFRGEGLRGDLKDTDPQMVGLKPLPAQSLSGSPGSGRMTTIVDDFIAQANRILRDSHPANTILMRGFDLFRTLPSLSDICRLKCAAIANYPMYRGVARLVGMEALPTGDTFADEIAALRDAWEEYDFFFLHFKKTDSSGEDGDFSAKTLAIDTADSHLPQLPVGGVDVLAITGDHSTPVMMKSHSWHPVPFLLRSPYIRKLSEGARFTERDCLRGELGIFPSQEVMPLLMAHAGRLDKFGA